MTTEMIPRMETVPKLAEELGMSRSSIYDLCRSGTIVHIRIGNRYYVNVDRLIDWLNSQKGEIA